ncbi:MAG: class I adenylate-forming enzyme family protein [Eubacteriales bacterium]
MFNSIVEAVFEQAKINPDKLAVADKNIDFTYQELVSTLCITSKWFQQKEFKTGDVILVECTQEVAFIVLDFVCGLNGMVFVPIEKNATKERVQDIYTETQAKCMIGITADFGIETFYQIEDVVTIEKKQVLTYEYEEKNSVNEILFTTGTTGLPKGIVISHKANVALAENISRGVEITSDTVEIIPLPLSHSHGLRTCYANLLVGGAVVIVDGVMNVALLFNLIKKYNVNAIDVSPTLAKILLKIAKKGLKQIADSIDYIEIGTAALEDDTKNQLKEIFPKTRLYNFYGSTEAGRTCVLDFNKFDETGCIGYPACNATFYFVDEHRKQIESSRENPGLIAVSGKMMMDEYLNSKELTEVTVVDGILYSNDLGYQDEAGRIYVLGRQDDIINYKGIKIAPEEIEGIAMKYEGIIDCACVPEKDAMSGQVPKLFVSIENSDRFDKKEYMKYLKERLEQNRVPTIIEIIKEIPRSSNGKLQRKKLM